MGMLGNILSGVVKGTVAAAKWAGNAALDAVASQGGPDYHYKLSFWGVDELRRCTDLNEYVERWMLRYMRGAIGSRDPYFKKIRAKLEMQYHSKADAPSGFVRNCLTSNVELFPLTDKVQKFSLKAILITGDTVYFDVSCTENSNIDKDFLRGF